jgi:hypothetical protein
MTEVRAELEMLEAIAKARRDAARLENKEPSKVGVERARI